MLTYFDLSRCHCPRETEGSRTILPWKIARHILSHGREPFKPLLGVSLFLLIFPTGPNCCPSRRSPTDTPRANICKWRKTSRCDDGRPYILFCKAYQDDIRDWNDQTRGYYCNWHTRGRWHWQKTGYIP